MNSLSRSIRAVLALSLIAAAPAAFATSAYTNGTTEQVGSIGTTPVALSDNGRVAVSSASSVTSTVCGWSCYTVTNTMYTPFVSAPGGTGFTQVGPNPGQDGGAGGYAYNSYSSNNNTFPLYVAAINNNSVAVNIGNGSGIEEGYAGVGASGAVTNLTSGNTVYTGNGTQIRALNNAGQVTGYIANTNSSGAYYTRNDGTFGFSPEGAGTSPGPVVTQIMQPFYEATATAAPELTGQFWSTALQANVNSPLTPTLIATLGFGGTGTAISSLGNVAGNDFLASNGYCNNNADCREFGNTEAFVTAAHGGAVSFLGFGGGVSSAATAVNSSGEVGGYVRLASGQTEAFLTDPTTNNLLVGVGSPISASDSTQVLFLNNAGQSIVVDTSTNTYYLYQAGTLYTMASLFAPGALNGLTIDGVAGLNSTGQILLQVSNTATGDPGLLASPTGAGFGTSQGTDITTLATFATLSGAQGGATPSHSFFSLLPADGGTPPSGGGSSVPEPASWGLFGLGLLTLAATLFGRKRRAVVGV